MISVVQAMQCIEQAMPRRPSELVSIPEACGRVLANNVLAQRDQPPFDRVMMDGIAINFSAFADGNTKFQRQGVQAAGASPLSLIDTTHCIEIMTGAVLPELCDCIIPIEQIRLNEQEAELESGLPVRQWQFIHRKGSDYRQDHVLLTGGMLVGGPEMAVLASAGPATVRVAGIPSVMIFAVGDELVDPGVIPEPAQIFRSNDFAIDTLLRQAGLGNNVRARLPDDPEILRKEIELALLGHDIVVLTGGVSMGQYDYIPSVMKDLGVEILLHKVSQTPGKPMWVGRRGDSMVFALPGNPVSSLVCARRYVIPALHGAMGLHLPPEQLALNCSVELHNTLTRFIPVILHNGPHGVTAEPRVPNTSGDFHTLAGTSGFVELPGGSGTLATGNVLPLWRW